MQGSRWWCTVGGIWLGVAAVGAALAAVPADDLAAAAGVSEVDVVARSLMRGNRSAAWQAADETGGGGGAATTTVSEKGGRWGPMLMSLAVPGLGEAYLGHKRGYLLMAIDVASWLGVKHHHDKGNEIRDDYYVYADLHWAESRLAAAFSAVDPEVAGTYYFGVTAYTELPLWVSREDDRREYYENLGKWDQFVFGWDDFQDPRIISDLGPDYNSIDLKDPRVSANREKYRSMRQESNDQFTKRDRLLYLNMATRIFSFFQVAYLEGLLGGGPSRMRVAGHPVRLIAEPGGWAASRVGIAFGY